LFQGSFVLGAYATVTGADGETTEHYLGHYSVLSRWNVINCANCLTHLEVIAHFPLSSALAAAVDRTEYRLEVQHRGADFLPSTGIPLNVVSRIDRRTELPAVPTKLSYKLEVRD
jgi:tyrosinase